MQAGSPSGLPYCSESLGGDEDPFLGSCYHVTQTGDTYSEAVWSHVYFTRMQNGYRDGMAYYISAQRLVWFAAAHVGKVNGAALRTESAPAESSSSWPSLGVAMHI